MKPFYKYSSRIVLSLLFTNCSSSDSAATEENQSFGSNFLSLDSSFGSAGCITPNYPLSSGPAKLYKLSDGFLSAQEEIVRHTANGEIDTSWGDQGYLTDSVLTAIINASVSTTNSFDLIGVDSQDRLYVSDNYVICRLTENLTLDTSWTDYGYAGCTIGKMDPLVEDSNGRMWQFYTNQSVMFANKYDSDGNHTNLDLGSKTTWVTGFTLHGPPVSAQGKVFLAYTSVDAQKVSHAKVLAVNINDNSQSDASSSLISGDSGSLVGIGSNSSNQLAVQYLTTDGDSLFKVVDNSLAVDSSFNGGQSLTISNITPYYSNMAAMDDGGMLVGWGTKAPVARVAADGTLIARYQPSSGSFRSLINDGSYSFGVHYTSGLGSKICRFNTP